MTLRVLFLNCTTTTIRPKCGTVEVRREGTCGREYNLITILKQIGVLMRGNVSWWNKACFNSYFSFLRKWFNIINLNSSIILFSRYCLRYGNGGFIRYNCTWMSPCKCICYFFFHGSYEIPCETTQQILCAACQKRELNNVKSCLGNYSACVKVHICTFGN